MPSSEAPEPASSTQGVGSPLPSVLDQYDWSKILQPAPDGQLPINAAAKGTSMFPFGLLDDIRGEFLVSSALQRALGEEIEQDARCSSPWGHLALGRGMVSGIARQSFLLQVHQDGFRQASMRCLSRFVGSQVRSLDVDGKAAGVSLRCQEDRQAAMRNLFRYPWVKTLMMSSLHNQGLLSPSPEIHWRVNRTGSEYERRFGVRMEEFFKEFADPTRVQTILELGPGSCTYKAERNAHTSGSYVDMALCNKLYYSVADLLERSLDFTKLEREARNLLQERGMPHKDAAVLDLHPLALKVISDFLHKILVIREGQTGEEVFEYDEEVMAELERDPESLREILDRKARLMADAPCVPDTVSKHVDGRVTYPNKILRPDPAKQPMLAAAFEIVARLGASALHPAETVLQHMPVYPPGVIVGDFDEVRHVADGDLDAVLSVRGLVYKRGAEYESLVGAIARKLSVSGLFVCDSIRDNDGWRYRLPEWLRVQDELRRTDSAMRIGVMVGPAFPGEDAYQGERGVPLAVVMTRSSEKIEFFQDSWNQRRPSAEGVGYRFVSLDELCADKEHLALLGEHGMVAAEVEETQRSLEPSALQ